MEFLIIALIWLIGTCYRIYKQARFYQIEEYMSGRYLRWCLAQRERWLPKRTLIAWVGGVLLGVVMSEAPGNFMLVLIGSIAAVVGVWPASEGEVKKGFKATARAKRMLGAAFVMSGLVMAILLVIVGRLPLPDIGEVYLVDYSFVGLCIFLSAPLFLIAGNWAMQPVEAYFRRRFVNKARQVLAEVNPVVVGITGSYGKTTTKNYLAHILSGRYKTYPTPKSYNTLMGVTLAINNDMANDHSIEYFICEMGAYIQGEIQQIAELTHPTISIVVEVGPQHLERFGTLENVATAKYEIIKALPPDGVGVFNWDNPHVREMYERGYPKTRLAVSRVVDPTNVPTNGPRFIASEISETLNGLKFTVTDNQTGEHELFDTTLLGEHNVTNVLLATAVAVHEGMKLRDVAFRVRALKPAESRLVRQTTAQGITIINDAYSANPTGVVSALKALALHQNGRRLLITPGMVELGPLHEAENKKLGIEAAKYASDIILVGAAQTAPIKAGLGEANFPADHLQTVEKLAEAVDWYQTNLKAGDTVLFLNDLPETYSS
ncbi:MAG: UDP-N-acetylmuramoyl-tripeptide--D-alanyl-D-alanine ligase [Chloroflexi bacterium]|nr:UDP-N-acetylmuramoyl-tripeptide--D-alanyl-D-alanine ligase [Chloroflexota bacterium]MCC6895662.1 UDP-N-acetylmuramoyl-tripeptide--D-alanyl-D-alanine ligase [Anaerolineae bacterium]